MRESDVFHRALNGKKLNCKKKPTGLPSPYGIALCDHMTARKANPTNVALVA